MKAKQKSMIMGMALVAALFVFMPNAYVWIASKLGKVVEIQKVG